jgi:hypothetical protein
MEAATDAPAERTVEATVLALVDTVLRHDDMILSEFGNKPLFFVFTFFIITTTIQVPPTHRSYSLRHHLPPPPSPVTPHPPSPTINISSDRRRRSDISSDYFSTKTIAKLTNFFSVSFRFDFEAKAISLSLSFSEFQSKFTVFSLAFFRSLSLSLITEI